MAVSADLKDSHPQKLVRFLGMPGKYLEYQVGSLPRYPVPEAEFKRPGAKLVHRHRTDVAELGTALVVLDVLRQSRRRPAAAAV